MDAQAARIATVEPAATRTRGGRPPVRLPGWLRSGPLIAVLGFLVLYPTAMLLIGALTTTNPVVEGQGILGSPKSGLLNTIFARIGIGWRILAAGNVLGVSGQPRLRRQPPSSASNLTRASSSAAR